MPTCGKEASLSRVSLRLTHAKMRTLVNFSLHHVPPTLTHTMSQHDGSRPPFGSIQFKPFANGNGYRVAIGSVGPIPQLS